MVEGKWRGRVYEWRNASRSKETNQHTKEGKTMKTTQINKAARFAGLVIALVLFAGVASEAKAHEDYPTKGGAKLLLRPNPASAPSDYKPMSCAKCKDEYVRRVDWSARGANKPTYLVAKHLCPGCDTTITTVGHGKAKQDVVTHKCTSCGADNLTCCSTSKSGTTATKGMEKK
jgi:hypothetical protein